MSRFVLLLALLSSPLFCALAAPLDAAPLLLPKDFPCGRYTIVGRFAVDAHNGDQIWIYPGTTAEFPVSVSGVPTDRALTLDDVLVKIEVELTRKKHYPVAKFQRFISASDQGEANGHPLLKINSAKCGSN